MLKVVGTHTLLPSAGTAVQLQEKLLEPDAAKNALKPDLEFLDLFSGVVGRQWPSLAASLSLSETEMQEVKERGEGLSDKDRALQMLRKWVSCEDTTYSKLCQNLKNVSLFQ